MGSGFDVANLHLLPKFNEHDPDTFFSLVEHVTEAKKKNPKLA